jgi:hypothetical protein
MTASQKMKQVVLLQKHETAHAKIYHHGTAEQKAELVRVVNSGDLEALERLLRV